MEAFTKLKMVIPCGVRCISMRFASSSKNNKEIPVEVQAQESPFPFSRDGDCGCSDVNGVLVPKNKRIFEAIGNTDELMCHLGVARENAIKNKHPYTDKLTRIQTMLIDIILAIQQQSSRESFSPQNTQELEEWIIHYSKELTPAEKYLLPGGGKVATSLHVARSICRRAERSIYPLVDDGRLDKEVQVYFNRLADLLFTWARFAAKQDERSESVYTPKSVKMKSERKPDDIKHPADNQTS